MKSMRLRWYGIVLALLIVTATAPGQTPRIDPAGLRGSLLVCGPKAGAAAFDRFLDLAGGENAKIAVVYLHRDHKDRAAIFKDLLSASAKKRKAAEPQVIAWAEAKAALPKLTGVWLVTDEFSGGGPQGWQKTLQAHPLRDEFVALLNRSGVVATYDHESNVVGEGLGLYPLGLTDTRAFFRKRRAGPGAVGFEVEPQAALLIKGRTLSAVGEGSTLIYLSPSQSMPIKLEGKSQGDLTALRRAAFDRANSFPPQKVEPPVVEKGTLVIVGGGGQPDNLHKKFVEYAGGEGKAVIAIFATAAPDPLPKREGLALAFKKAGAKKATVLYGQTQAEVESKEFLDTLKEATGLWFDGGRQWRFVDCYENTKALPLMFDVLQRGGVIGGTSAGATIQGEYLARGGVFHNFDIRYEGYERGLGFLKGVAIDQHFTQRKRQSEMTQLMKVYPQYLGIGLDEATAIVVKGSVADVIGTGKAHFYDANRKVEKGQPDYEALPAGGRYDLKERKVLAGEK